MEQSAELRDLALRFYEALRTGDLTAVERQMSRRAGTLVIGTDPAEWWTDDTTIRQVFKAQMEEMGGGVPVVAGEPLAYSEGSVGWVADRPKLKLPDGTELPFRLTAVYHLEDGEWKLVLSHTSLGVQNQEAVGKELSV